jgi:hypothetical protein
MPAARCAAMAPSSRLVLFLLFAASSGGMAAYPHRWPAGSSNSSSSGSSSSSSASPLAAAQQQQLWAGHLSFQHGDCDQCPVNATVSLGGSVGSKDVATISWVFTHASNGKPCVVHTEQGLTWAISTVGGAFEARGDSEGSSAAYYSFSGRVTSAGHIVANITHGSLVHGNLTLVRGAPRPGSSCVRKPVPPPPPLRPPTSIPNASSPSQVWPMPRLLEHQGADVLWLAPPHSFEFVAASGSASDALAAAFGRFRPLCFPHPTKPGKCDRLFLLRKQQAWSDGVGRTLTPADHRTQRQFWAGGWLLSSHD